MPMWHHTGPLQGSERRSDESEMRILMVAPPGAGKGTQGALIATHFNVPHIATGDLLRQHVAHETDLGRAVQELLARGELVPDEIVLGMVREAFIAAKEAGTGYVLDRIPRNMEQARAAYRIGLELRMTANVALHLQADDEEVTTSTAARAALEHRADDTEDVIRTGSSSTTTSRTQSLPSTPSAASSSRSTPCVRPRRSDERYWPHSR